MKWPSYEDFGFKHYFWRTIRQQEIDFLEESAGQMLAMECKWNPKARASFPSTFTDAYPQAEKRIISPDNIEEILGF